MAKKYLSLEEAAALLGMPAEQLIRLREKGELRGFADRGTWKFREDDVDEFGRRQQADSNPDVPIVVDDEPEGSSILTDDVDPVGEQATVVRKSVFDDDEDDFDGGVSDSDVRLIVDDRLTADSDPDFPIPTADSDSDVQLEDSAVGLVDDGASDSDVRMFKADSDVDAADSDVRLVGSDSDSDVQLAASDSDSDVRIAAADSDSDVQLEDSAVGLVDDGSDVGSDSDVLMVGADSDSDVQLEEDSGVSLTPDSGVGLADSDSDVRLAPAAGLDASDSDVQLISDDSPPSDSDVALIDRSASGGGVLDLSGAEDNLDDSVLGEDSALELGDDSSITLGEDSEIALSDDSGISLAAESGISLESVGDSGIALDAADDSGISLSDDSGIELSDATDSGIALEALNDVGSGTQPMFVADDFDDETGDTLMEVPPLDDESDFELQMEMDEDDDTAETSVILFDDDADEESATMVRGGSSGGFDVMDDEFDLDDADDDEVVTADVFGEDDELDVFDAADEDFDDSFQSGESHAEFVAPAGAQMVAVEEREWGAMTFVGLLFSTLLLSMCGIMIFDLVRTMWRWDEPSSVSSTLLETFGGMF